MRRIVCCARAESGHRAAEQRDELAPPHVEHAASSSPPPCTGHDNQQAPAVGLPQVQPPLRSSPQTSRCASGCSLLEPRPTHDEVKQQLTGL